MKRCTPYREVRNVLVAAGWTCTGLTANGQFVLEHHG